MGGRNVAHSNFFDTTNARFLVECRIVGDTEYNDLDCETFFNGLSKEQQDVMYVNGSLSHDHCVAVSEFFIVFTLLFNDIFRS